MNLNLFKKMLTQVTDETLSEIADVFADDDEWEDWKTSHTIQVIEDECARRAEERNKITQQRLEAWSKSQTQGETE